MLSKIIIPVTPLLQNCTLLWETNSKKGCFIDPGGDLEKLQVAAKDKNIHIQFILLTHGHLDHAAGAGDLARFYGVPIYGPQKDDRFLLENMTTQCLMYGFPVFNPFLPDKWLSEGDEITLGAQILEVYHTPGHTPGHVIYYHRSSQLAFVGDVLFQGSIGRGDLPGGHTPTLIRSICSKLWPLGEEVAFVPGHGPMSTFSRERKSNPYVADHVTRYKP